MLKIEDSIRIDNEMPPSRISSGRCPISVYIFLCYKCGNEIRSRKSYLEKHSGLCLTCSNRKSLPNALAKRRLRPFESVYNYLLSQDSKCNITYKDFILFTEINKCHYCDKDILWKEYSKATTINLDRKDNNLPHVKGNIVVCCGDCNRTKGDRFTYEEFMLLAPILKQIQTSRKE